MASDPCEHFDQTSVLTTDTVECAECVRMGSKWVHLRLCMVCGNVGCCDASPNKHASAHHRATHHPVIRSAEPDESWGYCYVDETFVKDVATLG